MSPAETPTAFQKRDGELHSGGMTRLPDERNPITPFAVTNWRDVRKVFGIKEKNRRGHMYLIGQTGTGKSTLILNMVVSDIRDGNGVALIDPHGDLAEAVLDYVPRRRIKDIIYVNPQDLDFPVAFNPLGRVPPDARHLAASGLLAVFKKLWPEFWGPRLEHILRHTLLTLLERPSSTLLDVPRLLTQPEFRAKVLAQVTNAQVRAFWTFEFEKYSAYLRSEAVAPILNKVGQFLVSVPVRNIVGQAESTFNLREVMDAGKILIVNLAKGKIGEDNAALLGALFVTQIQLAAMSRADLPEKQRRPFYLFVDEVHTFLTMSFADMLSEARKYGLSLVLAHQYVAQLDERIRTAVFGNVGTVIAFRVGVEDAEVLAREFAPVFSETDLVNLPNHHIVLKLMIDGVTSKAFSAVTLPPPKKAQSHCRTIIEQSRNHFARTRDEVERSILLNGEISATRGVAQGRLFA